MSLWKHFTAQSQNLAQVPAFGVVPCYSSISLPLVNLLYLLEIIQHTPFCVVSFLISESWWVFLFFLAKSLWWSGTFRACILPCVIDCILFHFSYVPNLYFLTYWLSNWEHINKPTYKSFILNTFLIQECIAQSLTFPLSFYRENCLFPTSTLPSYSSFLCSLAFISMIHYCIFSFWCFFCHTYMDWLNFILDITFPQFYIVAYHLLC